MHQYYHGCRTILYEPSSCYVAMFPTNERQCSGVAAKNDNPMPRLLKICMLTVADQRLPKRMLLTTRGPCAVKSVTKASNSGYASAARIAGTYTAIIPRQKCMLSAPTYFLQDQSCS